MELPMNGGIPILDDEMQRTEETKKHGFQTRMV